MTTTGQLSWCKGCGARMIWARTKHDRSMPLDVEPNPAGNCEFDGVTVTVHPVDYAWPPGVTRWMPHHATCPNWAKA